MLKFVILLLFSTHLVKASFSSSQVTENPTANYLQQLIIYERVSVAIIESLKQEVIALKKTINQTITEDNKIFDVLHDFYMNSESQDLAKEIKKYKEYKVEYEKSFDANLAKDAEIRKLIKQQSIDHRKYQMTRSDNERLITENQKLKEELSSYQSKLTDQNKTIQNFNATNLMSNTLNMHKISAVLLTSLFSNFIIIILAMVYCRVDKNKKGRSSGEKREEDPRDDVIYVS